MPNRDNVNARDGNDVDYCIDNLTNRHYDQYTGRWFTGDPIGYADAMNLYEYVQSNPVMKIDPLGPA